MNNNDIVRSLRYAMDSSDQALVQITQLGGVTVDRASMSNMLKREEEDSFLLCTNTVLDAFLDGLIIQRRGPMPARTDQTDQEVIPFSNNAVLKKIRIAFELREEDILALMDLAGFRVSRPEVNALFRKPGHKNFRPCGDQFLRNFLKGLALRLRAEKNIAKN